MSPTTARPPERLRECIASAGITHAQAARRIGVSPAALSTYLSGKATPGHLVREQIQKFTRGQVRVEEWTTEDERRALAQVIPLRRVRAGAA